MTRHKRVPSLAGSGDAGVGRPPAAPLPPGQRLRPWLLGGACALVVARPLFPSESAILRGDGLPVVMLWIALAVFWLLGAIGHREFRLRLGWVDGAVLVAVGLHTVSGVWAAAHASPRPALNALWEWIGLALSFLLVRQLVLGKREARAVVAVMAGLAVALAVYGLYQYFYDLPATRARYERDPEGMLAEAGLDYARGSRERELFENRLRSVEPLATFALTNSLAGLLAPWLIVVLGIAVAGTRRPGEANRPDDLRPGEIEPGSRGLSRTRLWLGVLGAAGTIGMCLVLTKSRTAYLATIAGVVLLGALWRVRARISGKLLGAAAAAVALLVALAIAAGGLDVQVLSEAGKSLGYRVQYWESSLGMIADHPWTGCGPGNFREAYPAYKLPTASEEIADPHNFLLEIWSTAGTPAMVAFVGVIAGFFVSAIRGRGRQTERSDALPGPAGAADDRAGDRPWFVLGGGAAGFLLGILIGLSSEAVVGPFLLILGLPAGAGTVALLWGWVHQGELPAALPAVAVVVVLVNLSAAGALVFPGVSGTLWLLMALGLNAAGTAAVVTFSRAKLMGLLVLVFGLGVACYNTAYSPVVRSRAAMGLAQEQPRRAEQWLLQAAKADPWAAEPWNRLASAAFSRWAVDGETAAFGQFERCVERACTLAPNSSPGWRMRGDCYFAAYQKMGRSQDLKEALKAYQRVVRLYPNDAEHQAVLALAMKAAGDGQGLREHGDRALWLDEITPHADRKLDRKLRDELRNSLQRNRSGQN